MVPSPEDAKRAPPDWEEFEHRIRAFEVAWLNGRQPRVEEFLEPSDPAGKLLVELVHADLEFRLRGGASVRVEEYVDRFPQLAENGEALRELMNAEVELRREIDPRLSAARTTAFVDDAEDIDVTLADTSTGAAAESDSNRRRHIRQRQVIEAMPASIGRFTVELVLGRGAFGTVYLATDPALGRQVAVKVPHPHVLADSTLRERILREARAAAALEHPHVVPVHEAGEVDGVCYLVSMYCRDRISPNGWRSSESLCDSRPRRRSSPLWPMLWTTATVAGSCTATSSRPTWCSIRDLRSRRRMSGRRHAPCPSHRASRTLDSRS